MRSATLPGLADTHCNTLLPQHDASTRELIAIVGQWQVRQFAETDPRMLFGNTHGLLHVQLWQPHLHVSILTPSRITGGKFEFCDDFERFAVATWRQMRIRCRRKLDPVGLPAALAFRGLEPWLASPFADRALALMQAWWRGLSLRGCGLGLLTMPRGEAHAGQPVEGVVNTEF